MCNRKNGRHQWGVHTTIIKHTVTTHEIQTPTWCIKLNTIYDYGWEVKLLRKLGNGVEF